MQFIKILLQSDKKELFILFKILVSLLLLIPVFVIVYGLEASKEKIIATIEKIKFII